MEDRVRPQAEGWGRGPSGKEEEVRGKGSGSQHPHLTL